MDLAGVDFAALLPKEGRPPRFFEMGVDLVVVRLVDAFVFVSDVLPLGGILVNADRSIDKVNWRTLGRKELM